MNVLKQLRTCDAKKAFATEEKAKNAAEALRRTLGKRLRAYECEMCGLWHLTKKAKR